MKKVASDWQDAFDSLDKKEFNNILEFGLGAGTDFLMDKANHVTSVELYHYDEHKGWFDKVKDKWGDSGRWVGYLHICDRDEYTKDVTDLISGILGEREWDIILVDPGVHFRGEIVQQCFGHAPIIIAHDTNRDVYGYSEIRIPEDYKVIYNGGGEGTTVWAKQYDK